MFKHYTEALLHRANRVEATHKKPEDGTALAGPSPWLELSVLLYPGLRRQRRLTYDKLPRELPAESSPTVQHFTGQRSVFFVTWPSKKSFRFHQSKLTSIGNINVPPGKVGGGAIS